MKIDNQNWKSFKIYFFIFLLCLASISNAQELKYKIDKPSKLFIGTPFHLLIDITSASEDTIYAPVIDTLDVFILKKQEQVEEILEKEKLTKVDLTFQTFDTGEFTFPELEFSVKKGDSLKILHTNEFQVIVQSVIQDSSQVIKDISDPLKVSLGFWDIFIPLLIIVILILVIRFLIKLMKKKPDTVQEIISDTPAWEVALELLDKLKSKMYLENNQFLKFHFRVSYIIRLFIELQYKINAVEMTTSEIRNLLILEDYNEKSEILQNLTFTDKVKFSKFVPKLEESKTAIVWLEKYLKSFDKVSNEQNE